MFWKVTAILLVVLLSLNLLKENKPILQNPNNPSASTQSITPPVSKDVLSTSGKEKYLVSKVIDGDTIQVVKNNQTLTLRLIGIDTPETVDPRRPIQCFGEQASKKAKELLSGKTVILEKDPTQGEKDKYGRTLAYIFLENKTNFNKLMIEEGFAHEYTYSTPYKYQKEFKSAEINARENKRGLWADGACNNQIVTPTKSSKTVTPEQVSQTTTNSISSNNSYTCDCSKKCTQIATCDEANYQLTTCGCSARDSDGDGIPCESLCK